MPENGQVVSVGLLGSSKLSLLTLSKVAKVRHKRKRLDSNSITSDSIPGENLASSELQTVGDKFNGGGKALGRAVCFNLTRAVHMRFRTSSYSCILDIVVSYTIHLCYCKLRMFLSLPSLRLSLSHSHTHTHTHSLTHPI